MMRALDLAAAARGKTDPNPPVGAVIALSGVVLGCGFTEPPPGRHAEIVALDNVRKAGHDPRGATLYSTLEPCCHHGKTPPCTDAIIAAGITRVVVGIVDPFPLVSGGGIRQLEEAGIEVTVGVLEDDCVRVAEAFLRRHGFDVL